MKDDPKAEGKNASEKKPSGNLSIHTIITTCLPTYLAQPLVTPTPTSQLNSTQAACDEETPPQPQGAKLTSILTSIVHPFIYLSLYQEATPTLACPHTGKKKT